MLDVFRLRHSDQRTAAILLAVASVLLCYYAAAGKQEMPDPKPYQFRIELNTATHGELQTLPGIGPKLADSIIQYRDDHAPIRDFNEMRNVRGIGPKRHDAMKPYFTE